MKILVLYRELADYMVNCLNQLQNQIQVTVVHYAINKEAPFQFTWNPNIIRFEKDKLKLEQLQIHDFDAILISGWADKEYMAVIKRFSGTKILMFDTPWENKIRHHLGSIYFNMKLKKHFHFAFVPGVSQVKFAQKIGFAQTHIRTGLYTAANEIVTTINKSYRSKSLWCVCRYVPQKNLKFLWNCFLQSKGVELGWKLHCAGTGEGWNDRIQDDNIIHHGFLQPITLNEELENATAFVLPSTQEPWGVVVHECAKKSLPLLLSKAIHSHKHFLIHSQNGFLFDPKNESELIDAMNSLFEKTEMELTEMGKISLERSHEISVKNWINNIMYFLSSNHVRN